MGCFQGVSKVCCFVARSRLQKALESCQWYFEKRPYKGSGRLLSEQQKISKAALCYYLILTRDGTEQAKEPCSEGTFVVATGDMENYAESISSRFVFSPTLAVYNGSQAEHAAAQ